MIRRGDNVKIVEIQGNDEINPKFLNKEGMVIGEKPTKGGVLFNVMVQALGMQEFWEGELEKI